MLEKAKQKIIQIRNQPIKIKQKTFYAILITLITVLAIAVSAWLSPRGKDITDRLFEAFKYPLVVGILSALFKLLIDLLDKKEDSTKNDFNKEVLLTVPKKLLLFLLAILIMIFSFLFIFSISTNRDPLNNPVDFLDPAFEQMLRDALNRPKGNIYAKELSMYSVLTIEGDRLWFEKKDFGNSKDIRLGTLKTLDDLKNFPALEILRIHREMLTNPNALNALGALKVLKMLRLPSNNITDPDALRNLESLTELDLSNNNIENLDRLRGLTNLKWLKLTNTGIENLASLENLTNLTALYLDQNKIKDITPLKNLKYIEYLYLNNNQIDDLEPLTDLENLIDLHLNNNKINDLRPLKHFDKMKELWLNNNKIDELYPLSSLLDNTQLLLIGNPKITD